MVQGGFQTICACISFYLAVVNSHINATFRTEFISMYRLTQESSRAVCFKESFIFKTNKVMADQLSSISFPSKMQLFATFGPWGTSLGLGEGVVGADVIFQAHSGWSQGFPQLLINLQNQLIDVTGVSLRLTFTSSLTGAGGTSFFDYDLTSCCIYASVWTLFCG